MAERTVEVWTVTPPDDPASVVAWLPDDEARLVSKGGDGVRPAARAALRRLLGERLGTPPEAVEIFRTCRHCGDASHGKPFVAGPVGFSVSHTDGLGLVAVSTGIELGVDLERLDRRQGVSAEALHRRVLGDAERLLLVPLDERSAWVAFLRLWAAKEAATKADGRGIVVGLAGIDASSFLDAPRGSVDVDGERWSVHEIALPAPYLGVLAADSPVDVVVRGWRW